jgi:hypothetical protein
MVLNGNRQVVFGNMLFLQTVGARTVQEMIREKTRRGL